MTRKSWLGPLAVGMCGAVIMTSSGKQPQAVPADWVIIGAKVWTGNDKSPEAQAVAVRHGRFARVGRDEDIKALIGPQTRVIDGGGRRVIPGLIDAHTHLISAGLQMQRLNLREAADRGDFVRRVAERAKELGPGKWVLGGRWTVDSWADPAAPCTEWIDPVTPDNPVFLARMDGHTALANSAALKLAGITREGPPDPEGGKIDRDRRTGEPTGLLRDDAMELVSRHIPEPGQRELDAALQRAMRRANRWGITMVHDMSEWRDITTFARAMGHGDPDKMTLRIYAFYSTADWSAGMDRIKLLSWGGDMCRVVGFKGFMDGSLGSRTAYMAAPFADNAPDQKDWRGLLAAMADPPVEMRERCLRADRAGFQTAIHAIGDQANHLLLDTYQAVQRTNGKRDRRQRIEHAQHLLPEDIARFAELGVVASLQPYHKADDGRYAERALGAGRLRSSYAFRSLLDHGATVAFGSDWPVVTNNPFAGMAVAVTGRIADGTIWLPSQNITVEQALRCYTIGGARACFMEDRLGTIEPGKLADLVMLDRDLLAVPSARIADVEPVMTIVAGRVVWSRDNQRGPEASVP